MLSNRRIDWPDANDPARALALGFLYEELNMPDAALEQYRKVPQRGEQVEARVMELERRLRLRE